MLKNLKRWMETRSLADTAKKAVADPQVSIDAFLAGQTIISGIRERKQICRFCFRTYELKSYGSIEMLQVKSILMIPDNEPNPMLCDECFTTVFAVYNQQVADVGTSNTGYSNMVLKESSS